MYVTRPLSLYRRSPASLSVLPPEGPNSGILVIQDEEAETTKCFGLCKDREIRDLPIPQNKSITIRYSSGGGQNPNIHHSSGGGVNRKVSYYYVMLIPVLNQPLSSNRYYAIQARGKRSGEAHTSSTEEGMGTCCFCTYIQDVKSSPLDPHNIYQQFEICLHDGACNSFGGFYAKSVAPDGYPPSFLRRKGWKTYTKTPKYYELGDAPGLNTALRARLPDFNFPLSRENSEIVVVGKWYCPYMFIKEGTLKDQVKRSMYYEMTLEQRWEQIFACENNHTKENAVTVDAVVQREVVLIAGKEVAHDERNVVDGVKWFRSFDNAEGDITVGLSLKIVERMKWEQERFGWVGGSDRQVSVKRVEEFRGKGEWTKFGCYVLVERFVLKRMDGSLALTCDYKHTHQIKTKWE